MSASATPGGYIDRNLIGFDLSVIQQAHYMSNTNLRNVHAKYFMMRSFKVIRKR